jgi:hypothetical protein
MRYLLAIPAAITAAYLAWAHGTSEGREIGRLYRAEMAHYKTSHASANPRIR